MPTSNHFSNAELRCSCCGRNEVTREFLNVLEAIRHEYGKPMIVTSGYRCAAWNNRVSSTGTSGPHTTGEAVDIKVSGADAVDLAGIAYKHGIKGFGHKQHGNHAGRFLHFDTLKKRTWTYAA